MSSSRISMALPGPKAQALIARDHSVTSPSYPRDYPFVIAKGRGAEVWDVDGNRFLDFMGGIGVVSTGHAHPQVVQAIREAAEDFLHISSDYWHERMTRLAERLNGLNPVGEAAQVFLCQSGTESVEAALKLARYVTGRPRFIGFLGGFHGRSMGSLAFTSSKYTQQAGFFPTMPGVTHVPYPNLYRPLLAGPDQGNAVIEYIENVLFACNVPANEAYDPQTNSWRVLAPLPQGRNGVHDFNPGGCTSKCAYNNRHGPPRTSHRSAHTLGGAFGPARMIRQFCMPIAVSSCARSVAARSNAGEPATVGSAISCLSTDIHRART